MLRTIHEPCKCNIVLEEPEEILPEDSEEKVWCKERTQEAWDTLARINIVPADKWRMFYEMFMGLLERDTQRIDTRLVLAVDVATIIQSHFGFSSIGSELTKQPIRACDVEILAVLANIMCSTEALQEDLLLHNEMLMHSIVANAVLTGDMRRDFSNPSSKEEIKYRFMFELAVDAVRMDMEGDGLLVQFNILAATLLAITELCSTAYRDEDRIGKRKKIKHLLPYKQHIIKSTRIGLITSNHACKVLFTT